MLGVAAAGRLLEHRPHPLAQGGVVALARHEDEEGDRPAERVRPHEQPDPLPVLQVQDLGGDGEELVLGGLHQLVARIGLEDVGHRLGGVAARREGRAGDHPVDLAPQQRHLARIEIVGGRGEQAEEPALAHDRAVGGVALDADEVEPGGAMHRAAGVGLGDGERRQGCRGLRPHRLGQSGEAARDMVDRAVAQDAERRLGQAHLQPALGRPLEVVAAEAQEGEVVVDQPVEEGPDLGQLVGRQHVGGTFELAQRGGDALAHRPPVLDGVAHVAEHALEILLQPLLGRRVALPVHLEMHEALGRRLGTGLRADGDDAALPVAADPQHGVDDEMHAEAVAAQLHADAVDQEGHVVGDDLDDRVRRAPAMLLDVGVVGADPGLAGAPLLAEAEMGQRAAVEVERLALDEIRGGDVAEIAPQEGLDDQHLGRRQPGADLLHELLDKLRLSVFCTAGHATASRCFPARWGIEAAAVSPPASPLVPRCCRNSGSHRRDRA